MRVNEEPRRRGAFRMPPVIPPLPAAPPKQGDGGKTGKRFQSIQVTIALAFAFLSLTLIVGAMFIALG
jgi:hypothetical protein